MEQQDDPIRHLGPEKNPNSASEFFAEKDVDAEFVEEARSDFNQAISRYAMKVGWRVEIRNGSDGGWLVAIIDHRNGTVKTYPVAAGDRVGGVKACFESYYAWAQSQSS